MKLSEYIKKQLEAFKKPYYFEENATVDRQEIIQRINHYKRNLYFKCTDDDAIFWNISQPRIPHFKKNIIINIKDLYPEGRGEYNYFQSMITKIRFRKWCRDTGFSDDTDDLAINLSEYGECVLKIMPKTDDKDVKPCNLRMIHFDRTVDFKYSDKIEIHELTEAQILSKRDSWKDVDEIIKIAEVVNANGQGIKKYRLYEFWGYYKETELDKPEFMHKIVAGNGDKEIIAFDFKDAKEDKPIYYYFKLNDELIGLYERLFVLQELANKRVNQNDEAQAIASLLLLRSNDANTNGNVLKQATSGQIINSADLEQIGIDNRALNGFLAEMNAIEAQADRLCMTPEVITGADMPSNTPFRSTAAMINKAVKAFKSIRTKIASNIIKMLETDIFPHVVSGWEDQYMDIADNDNDIQNYDKYVGQFLLKEWVGQIKEQAGFFPTMQEIEEKRIEIIQNFEDKGRRIFINKKFFNWDYGFIYNATNEIEDRDQQNDVMNNLLIIKSGNPVMANDPLFKQLAEKNGISATKISQSQIQEQIQGMAQGGQVPQVKPKGDKLMSRIDSE